MISMERSAKKSNVADIVSRLSPFIWVIALKSGLSTHFVFWLTTKEDNEKLNRINYQ